MRLSCLSLILLSGIAAAARFEECQKGPLNVPTEISNVIATSIKLRTYFVALAAPDAPGGFLSDVHANKLNFALSKVFARANEIIASDKDANEPQGEADHLKNLRSIQPFLKGYDQFFQEQAPDTGRTGDRPPTMFEYLPFKKEGEEGYKPASGIPTCVLSLKDFSKTTSMDEILDLLQRFKSSKFFVIPASGTPAWLTRNMHQAFAETIHTAGNGKVFFVGSGANLPPELGSSVLNIPLSQNLRSSPEHTAMYKCGTLAGELSFFYYMYTKKGEPGAPATEITASQLKEAFESFSPHLHRKGTFCMAARGQTAHGSCDPIYSFDLGKFLADPLNFLEDKSGRDILAPEHSLFPKLKFLKAFKEFFKDKKRMIYDQYAPAPADQQRPFLLFNQEALKANLPALLNEFSTLLKGEYETTVQSAWYQQEIEGLLQNHQLEDLYTLGDKTLQAVEDLNAFIIQRRIPSKETWSDRLKSFAGLKRSGSTTPIRTRAVEEPEPPEGLQPRVLTDGLYDRCVLPHSTEDIQSALTEEIYTSEVQKNQLALTLVTRAPFYSFDWERLTTYTNPPKASAKRTLVFEEVEAKGEATGSIVSVDETPEGRKTEERNPERKFSFGEEILEEKEKQ